MIKIYTVSGGSGTTNTPWVTSFKTLAKAQAAVEEYEFDEYMMYWEDGDESPMPAPLRWNSPYSRHWYANSVHWAYVIVETILE